MKTSFEVNDYLFTLATASIGTSLTGGVYKLERPRDSKLEDIVVSSLPISEASNPQVATCNVNIHVPNKYISIDGMPHSVADNARMEELASILITAMDEGLNSSESYHYRVTKQTIIEEPGMDEHFFNIRLELRMY